MIYQNKNVRISGLETVSIKGNMIAGSRAGYSISYAPSQDGIIFHITKGEEIVIAFKKFRNVVSFEATAAFIFEDSLVRLSSSYDSGEEATVEIAIDMQGVAHLAIAIKVDGVYHNADIFRDYMPSYMDA